MQAKKTVLKENTVVEKKDPPGWRILFYGRKVVFVLTLITLAAFGSVQPDLHVLEFKKMVESSLKVPVNQQKLLLKGKLLLDWKKLNDYDIKEDSKLNLVVLSDKEFAPNTSKSPRKDILEIEMIKFLRRYFSDSDAKKISEEYMKEFYRKTSACNLEDWERIATGYLNEEKSKQKPS